MTRALGLAGDDRLAAGLCLIFKVCGAGGGFGHVHKGTPTKDHGSRLVKKPRVAPQQPHTFSSHGVIRMV
jgi:hypothetical protein